MQLTTVAGETSSLDDGAVESLRDQIRGEVLGATDPGYMEARRIWNGMITKRPGLIARCAGTADVIAAVRFARERDLLVSVRGGGHGFAGHALSDGGLMIDLAPMRGVWVDPERRVARVQGGALWGDLDGETQVFGLAVTGGIVSHTGIAGLTLGGGIGHLMRKHGLTVDNLLSVDLVTAEGEFVRVSEDSEPDLFWGLRGGGGNFGIATSFEFRLHPVGPTVLAGPLVFPADQGPELVRFYRDFAAEAPDELVAHLNLRLAPPAPFLPPEVHGTPVVMVLACYAGEISGGEKALAPLRGFRDPAADAIGPMRYAAVQQLLNPFVPHGRHYYLKAWELPGLSDEVIDTFLAHLETITSPLSLVPVFHLGGAVSRIAEDATAYGNRAAKFTWNATPSWMPDDPEPERHIEWARGFHEALRPYATGAYVNFLSDEGHAGLEAAYGRERLGRLRALKARYDPTNFFRLNQNIPPAT